MLGSVGRVRTDTVLRHTHGNSSEGNHTLHLDDTGCVLNYLIWTPQDKFLLRCVQFYLNRNCETVVSPNGTEFTSVWFKFESATHSTFDPLTVQQLEVPLELPAEPFGSVR